jgi:hypothetical protein
LPVLKVKLYIAHFIHQRQKFHIIENPLFQLQLTLFTRDKFAYPRRPFVKSSAVPFPAPLPS